MHGLVFAVAPNQEYNKGNGKQACKNPMSGGDVFHVV
jgi:hypothetical protein